MVWRVTSVGSDVDSGRSALLASGNIIGGGIGSVGIGLAPWDFLSLQELQIKARMVLASLCITSWKN